MNRFENFLSKWNFKKIVIIYLIIALITAIVCVGTIGYIFRERINFAYRYSRLEETKDSATLENEVQKTANASDDVVDILIIDKTGKVTYSAKNSKFSTETFELTKAENEKKYLISNKYPDAAFQYVKSEEFMLNSIINKDFGKIRSDYDDDSAFDSGLSSKTIYMLSRIKIDGSDNKVCVITVPTSVPGGMTALKTTAAVVMLFFCVYWVLIALWMYKDAAKCKLSPLYWGFIGLFTNIIGLIVYKIYKHNMTTCAVCKATQNADHLYCSYCGSVLGTCCKNCGCKVDLKDAFCHHCGNKIK